MTRLHPGADNTVISLFAKGIHTGIRQRQPNLKYSILHTYLPPLGWQVDGRDKLKENHYGFVQVQILKGSAHFQQWRIIGNTLFG